MLSRKYTFQARLSGSCVIIRLRRDCSNLNYVGPGKSAIWLVAPGLQLTVFCRSSDEDLLVTDFTADASNDAGCFLLRKLAFFTFELASADW